MIMETEIKPKSLLEEAKDAAAELRKANKELKEEMEVYEKLKAETESIKVMGGRSTAGTPAPEVDAEQAKRDRINKMLASTGMRI